MNEVVAPDYVSPIVGWRFWKIRRTCPDGNLWLRSIVRNELWPPMERFEAQCPSNARLNERGIPPDAFSKCGIYAYKTSSHAVETLDRCCYRGTFLGKVNLWGTIQKHHSGYRAQFAYPVSLAIGICCICKRIVKLKSEPFAIGWAAFHFTEAFSVSGFLCKECNEKYYSLEFSSSYDELISLTDRYGMRIE